MVDDTTIVFRYAPSLPQLGKKGLRKIRDSGAEEETFKTPSSLFPASLLISSTSPSVAGGKGGQRKMILKGLPKGVGVEISMPPSVLCTYRAAGLTVKPPLFHSLFAASANAHSPWGSLLCLAVSAAWIASRFGSIIYGHLSPIEYLIYLIP